LDASNVEEDCAGAKGRKGDVPSGLDPVVGGDDGDLGMSTGADARTLGQDNSNRSQGCKRQQIFATGGCGLS